MTKTPGMKKLLSASSRFALAVLVAGGVTAAPAGAVVADYSIQYVEVMPVKASPTDDGVVPGAIVPSYSSDGEWIYYHAHCSVFSLSPLVVFPDCPTDGSGHPDYVYHAWRIRTDGTDNECLTCGTTSGGGNPNWGRHSGSPEPHGNWMLFSRERASHPSIPPGSCGGGLFAPGAGFYHDLYVLNLSTGVETLLHTSVSPVIGADPGTLDPRWSDDGTLVTWSGREETGSGSNVRLGDWRIKAAYFYTGGGMPVLRGVNETTGGDAGSGTTPDTYDPGQDGTIITSGFTRAPGGALSGIYFGGNARTGQDTFNGDINVMPFSATSTFVDLTNTSGLSGEPAEYEEHAHLNQKYWDSMLWMTGPKPTVACFLEDLETDLYMMAPNGADRTQFSFYNNGLNWLGLNPGNYRTIVSKLQWAPNGVDAAVSVNFITNEDTDPGTAGKQMAWDTALSIYHFKRYQNPTANSASSGNGFETSITNAYADGGGLASNVNGTGDIHQFSNFDLSIPKTVDPADIEIDGFEVRLDWSTDSATHNPYLAVRLWDGSAWTAWKATTTGSTSLRADTLGGAADDWGGSWTAADLLNGAFKIEVASYCVSPAACTSAGRDFNLDWVAVKPTWHVN